jgi:hypothetical protein
MKEIFIEIITGCIFLLTVFGTFSFFCKDILRYNKKFVEEKRKSIEYYDIPTIPPTKKLKRRIIIEGLE